MKGFSAVLLSAAVLGGAAPAFGQSPPPPTFEDFAGTAVAPATPGAPAPSAPGTVSVRVRSTKKREVVRLYRMVTPDRFALVCMAPCTAALRPGDQLRATWNDGEEGHDFALATEAGRDVDLDVGPPKRGGLALGIVLVSVGGLGVITGIALSAIGAAAPVEGSDDLLIPGLVTLGLSAGLTFGGASLIVNRTTEPRVWQGPAGEGSVRGEMKRLPRAATPLGFSVAF